MPETKAQLTTRIRTMLDNNDFALETAILRIYERQTAAEQETQTTTEHNGMGFTAFDAEFLSSFAEQITLNRYGRTMGSRLSVKQREIARRKMGKYAGQLAKIADEKAARVAAKDAARAVRVVPGTEVETEEERELAGITSNRGY
jgi:hypothetical protein